MGKGCKVLHKDCDPTMCEDRTLPYTAYMVEYVQDGITKYDIVTAPKRVDIFDDYWDVYRHDFMKHDADEGVELILNSGAAPKKNAKNRGYYEWWVWCWRW